jgi:hypothetical protein
VSGLTEAVTEHHALLQTIDHQIEQADSAPVELWALRVVKAQLELHKPEVRWGQTVTCAWCEDDGMLIRWPCETYELIEKESRHGE